MRNRYISYGDRVRDDRGNWYEVEETISIGLRYRVKPMKRIGTELFPIGESVVMERKQLRAEGEYL